MMTGAVPSPCLLTLRPLAWPAQKALADFPAPRSIPPPLQQVGINLAAQLRVGGCCVYIFPLGIINQGQHCLSPRLGTIKKNTSTTESGAGNLVCGKPSESEMTQTLCIVVFKQGPRYSSIANLRCTSNTSHSPISLSACTR